MKYLLSTLVMLHVSILNGADAIVQMDAPASRAEQIAAFINTIRGGNFTPLRYGGIENLSPDDDPLETDTVSIKLESPNTFNLRASSKLQQLLSGDTTQPLAPIAKFFLARAYFAELRDERRCFARFGCYPQVSTLGAKAWSIAQLGLGVGAPAAIAVLFAGYTAVIPTMSALAGVAGTLSIQDVLKKLGVHRYPLVEDREDVDLAVAAAQYLNGTELIRVLGEHKFGSDTEAVLRDLMRTKG